MVEIILTFFCLLVTVFFVAVLSKKYQTNVETNSKRPSEEVALPKTTERGTCSLDSYGGSNDFGKSSDEAGSEIIVRRKTKQLNKTDYRRNKKNDKGNESDDKGNENDDKGNKNDDKGNKNDDKGNKTDEADINELLSRNGIENEDSIEEEEEYNKFSAFVNEEELKMAMANDGTTIGLFRYIKKSLDDWKEREINVAVTGNAGTGKSSLINALRNLKPTDQGAAKVGVVETTTEGQKYTYPNNEHVALWDLPGTGTQTFAKDTYLDTMNFSRFDVIIIVTATRFLENDIWLAKEILKLDRHVLFVRTKIDFDMANSRRDHPDDFSETEITKKIKENVSNNLQKGGLANMASRIYLVSSPDRALYDFSRLDENLKSLLNIRGKAIRFLLDFYVTKVIRAKQKNPFTLRPIHHFLPLRVIRVMGALSSCTFGDYNGLRRIAKKDFEECLEIFCLDEKSLDKISQEMCISKDVLKTNLKAYILVHKNIQNIPLGENTQTVLESTKRKIKNPFVGDWKLRIPYVNWFFYLKKGVRTSHECLGTICDVMAEDELHLIRIMLTKLEADLSPL